CAVNGGCSRVGHRKIPAGKEPLAANGTGITPLVALGRASGGWEGRWPCARGTRQAQTWAAWAGTGLGIRASRRLNERENPSLEGVGQAIPGSHDAGQIGRQRGPRIGTWWPRHHSGHLAAAILAQLFVGYSSCAIKASVYGTEGCR